MSSFTVQYAAVYRETGAPVTMTHCTCSSSGNDDDTPLVADSLQGLFILFQEWTDLCDDNDVLASLEHGGENEGIVILRQEVKSFKLDMSILRAQVEISQ